MSFKIDIYKLKSEKVVDTFNYISPDSFEKKGTLFVPVIKWKFEDKPTREDIPQSDGKILILKSKILAYGIDENTRFKINNGKMNKVNYIKSATGIEFWIYFVSDNSNSGTVDPIITS